MKKSSTSSEKYRQRDNEIFAKLKQEEHATLVIRQGPFTDALKCYNQALSTCVNDDERASAYKNLGVLYGYQIGNISIESINKNDLDYTSQECITAYEHAFKLGKHDLLHRTIKKFRSYGFIRKTTKSNEWLDLIPYPS
jgi:hypothetical protein